MNKVTYYIQHNLQKSSTLYLKHIAHSSTISILCFWEPPGKSGRCKISCVCLILEIISQKAIIFSHWSSAISVLITRTFSRNQILYQNALCYRVISMTLIHMYLQLYTKILIFLKAIGTVFTRNVPYSSFLILSTDDIIETQQYNTLHQIIPCTVYFISCIYLKLIPCTSHLVFT